MSGSRKRSLLLAACALSLLLALLLILPTGRSESMPTPPDTEEISRPVQEEVELGSLEEESSSLSPAEHEDRTSRRTAFVPGAASVGRRITEPSTSSFGRLRIQAVDSESRKPLSRIRVRALSNTRIADLRPALPRGQIELVLTPDLYSVLVLEDGYEPFEFPQAIQVVAGETVAPDPVLMRLGSASITGAVIGMRPDLGLWAELRGSGRRPCPRCSTEPEANGAMPAGPRGAWDRRRHCAYCGYAQSSTRTLVTSRGGFAFDRLVGGSYAVTLTTPDGRPVGLTEIVTVQPHLALAVQMPAAGHRLLRVEMVDTDGRSIASEWSRRILERTHEGSEAAESPSESEVVERIRFQCTFRCGETWLASSVLTPPDEFERRERPTPFSGRKLGRGPRSPKRSDDRVREPSERLWPEAIVPTVQPAVLTSGVDDDGLAVFELVSTLPSTLEMTAGPFTGSAPIPESWDPTRIRMTLTRAAAAPDTESKEPSRTYLEFEAARDP